MCSSLDFDLNAFSTVCLRCSLRAFTYDNINNGCSLGKPLALFVSEDRCGKWLFVDNVIVNILPSSGDIYVVVLEL